MRRMTQHQKGSNSKPEKRGGDFGWTALPCHLGNLRKMVSPHLAAVLIIEDLFVFRGDESGHFHLLDSLADVKQISGGHSDVCHKQPSSLNFEPLRRTRCGSWLPGKPNSVFKVARFELVADLAGAARPSNKSSLSDTR